MMGVDKALLRHWLLIEGEWEITDYSLDLRKRRCDVWVGPQIERSWFGRPKGSPPDTHKHAWLHLPYGSMRVVIHAAVPTSLAEPPKLPWMGTAGMPFTTALAQQVFTLVTERVPLPTVCTLLRISVGDAMRYRFVADRAQPQVARPAPAAAPQAAATPSGAVPAVVDPVWMRLVSGDLQIDIRALGLKLMLTRVRSQFELATDDPVERDGKLRELHRFFLMNERVLAHELAQLKAG